MRPLRRAFNGLVFYCFVCSRQEALEAAISERDSQLALLEVSGIKTAKTAEHADRLKADKKRLMELMKEQVAALLFTVPDP